MANIIIIALPDASSVLATSKEFGKILSLSIYSFIFAIFFQDNVLGDKAFNYLLIKVSNYMMIITAAVTLSAAVLLIYSRYFHGEEKINSRLLKQLSAIKVSFTKKFN